jgi:Protein of unknown function (DUF2911)
MSNEVQFRREEAESVTHGSTRGRVSVVGGALLAGALCCPVPATAQAQTGTPGTPARRVASPPGESATETGGRFDERLGYVEGKWLRVLYGRPIKRGRDLFGTADFADFLYDGGPVWRAGANVSTRLITEVPIVIAGSTIAPGEYTLFIEFESADKWTFIVSTWPAMINYDHTNTAAVFGAYGYTPARDVVRAPMTVERFAYSFDQLSWQFADMTAEGGRLVMLWDRHLASVPFRIQR